MDKFRPNATIVVLTISEYRSSYLFAEMPMRSPKYLATGLRLGLVEPSEVQAWVNVQITDSENPTDELLSLAYTKESDIHGMYMILSGIAGESDEYEAMRLLLR